MDLVNQASTLAVAEAGLGPAEQLPFEIELVDLAVAAVAAIQVLRCSRCDANTPGSAHSGDGSLVFQICVVYLNPVVAAVCNVNIVVCIRGNAVRCVELILPGT